MASYKINSMKSAALYYSNDKHAEKEIKEKISLTTVTNNMKYIGVNLTKQVMDLYDNNFKSLKTEIKEDLRKWKDLHAHRLEGSTL